MIDALEENKDALDNEFEANQIGERINEWVTTASQTDELTASRFGASIDTDNVMPESGEGSSRIEEVQCLGRLLLHKIQTNP